MIPQQADSIVQEALREMMDNPLCTPEIIKMVIAHLRETLALLVTIEPEDHT